MGRRFYHVEDARTAMFHTLGLTAGLVHDCYSGYPGCSNGWTGGVFAEFGGTYFVTSHLSLGGAMGLSFIYQRSKYVLYGNVTSKTWSYNGSVSAPFFISTFYF